MDIVQSLKVSAIKGLKVYTDDDFRRRRIRRRLEKPNN
jgi:hypothetical protein